MNIKEFLREYRISKKGMGLWISGILAVVTAAVLISGMSVSSDQVFPVYFTEVVASNSAYPNAEGLCCDYIELYNGADYPVDLSGFQIGDIAGKSRYAIPEGLILAPGDYLVIYCDKTGKTQGYAPFEISRAGGESFYLIAENGALADSVITVAMDTNQAMTLVDGEWLLSELSPYGNGNLSDGEAETDIYNPDVSPVRISEYTTCDAGYLPGYGVNTDWVELFNSSDQVVDISGYTLSDNVGNDKYVFPSGTQIAPRGYLVQYCTNRCADPAVAPFGLSSRTTENLVLKDSQRRIIQIVRAIPIEQGSAILTDEGKWQSTLQASPGYSNTQQGVQDFLYHIGAETGNIRISEVMAAQQLVIPDGFDEFPDWVELWNTSDHAIDLSGWALSDDPTEPNKWIISQLVLQPDERTVIFCSGRGVSDEGQLHAEFSLSASGESLMLSAWSGDVVDSVSFPSSDDHCSFAFDENGNMLVTEYPTPGYPNDMEGYELFCTEMIPAGPLALWEVMSYNRQYLPQKLGECYDWVELKNISNETIDLSRYSISDDLQDPGMHKLPQVNLDPGETFVVILSSEPDVALQGVDQALFSLDSREDQLFLFGAEGKLLDFAHIKDIPYGYSYGRTEGQGGFGYMKPTPENPNTAGTRCISGSILASWDPGVFVQEEGCVVTMESVGDIYYTTDGSTPTKDSFKYDGPIEIEKTTVLRAVSIEPGKLPGAVYTATFIIGQSHDLPVVSLVTDPENLWGRNGIYKDGDITVKEIRVPAHVSYTGSDGSFAINCETNLHGATTVTAFPKKTFAIRFQDYMDGPLHYDVFEDGEVTSFRSLLIRTAHESSISTQMHDALISQVAADVSDNVLSQKYKYAVLYLNGEYWGIYALRERHSPEHYASYRHVPADTVHTVRFMVDEPSNLQTMYKFLESNSLRNQANYEYVCSVIDVESYADWIIFETYVDNMDINGNVRYYYSSAEGKWVMGLADLDLGMVGATAAFGTIDSAFHHGRLIGALLDNEEFQVLIANRLAYLLSGPMSDENMIARIQEMAEEIRSETPNEQARWGSWVAGWESSVRYMIDFCDGRAKEMIDSFCTRVGFTREEKDYYFGEIG